MKKGVRTEKLERGLTEEEEEIHMTQLKKRWYSFTLIGILIALSFMVAYNYWIFSSFETLAHIQKKHTIPIVFMSADKKPEDVEKAAEFGVEYYLTKPFYSLDLKEIIRSNLY